MVPVDRLLSVKVELETRFLQEVEQGASELVPFDAGDVGRARKVIREYSNLAVGLADASLVVLAHKHGIQQILTLDQRHFRTLPGPLGPFRLLPLDA